MDVESFKKEVRPCIEVAINSNGGIDNIREMYRAMPSIIDFIAGWVAGSLRPVQVDRAGTPHTRYTLEETRRIYDLVRLRIDSGSSTS
jgi:hypothetical protein